MDKYTLGNRDLKAYGILLLVALLYGSSIVVAREIAGAMPPVFLAALRGILGILALLPLVLPEIQNTPRPAWSDWFMFILLGFLGITVCLTSFMWGIQYTTATNASIIFASIPAVTNTLLAAFWKKPPQGLQVAGIILAFLGLLLVVTEGSWQKLVALTFNPGDTILLLNVVAYSVFNIVGHGIMERYTPMFFSFYSLAFGTIFMLPLAIWQGLTQTWQVSWGQWLAVLYMGVFVTGLALYLNLMGVKKIGSGQAAIFGNLQPVFSFLLALMLLNEKAAVYHWVGFGCVLLGLVVSVWKTNTGTKKSAQLEC